MAMLCVFASAFMVPSCAIFSVGRNAKQVFLSEEDTGIAASAFPVLIKTSEILLASSPRDRDTIVTTASLYVMYASAFVSGPADFLPDDRYEERENASRRALALYRRAFRILRPAIEAKAPGLFYALGYDSAISMEANKGEAKDPGKLLARFNKSDVPLLYWTAASLLAAFSINALDLDNARGLESANRLLSRASSLDPSWNAGAIEEIRMTLYASLPDYMGGSMEKAEESYMKAFAWSGGNSASLYVSYATSICVPRDDYAGFKAALLKALAVDPDLRPEARLATILARENAERILAQPERYFLLPDGDQTP